MEAYRDQYATIFNNGRKVVVFGISTDADTLLANWARESSFPFLFGSDMAQSVIKLYGSARARTAQRNVFVIGPDGRIASRIVNFNVLSAESYEELTTMVHAVAGKPEGGD